MPFTNLPPRSSYPGSWSSSGGLIITKTLFLVHYPNARSRHFLAKELRFRLTARDERIKEERKARPELNPRARRRWWRSPISTLLHRSTTLRDEIGHETDSSHSSKKNHKNRRVRPDMIRRIDDKPKLVNPSGWISEGPPLAAQEGGNLAESGSTRSRSSIREPGPTNPNPILVQSPESIHSQPSGQRSNDSEAESESELEDLNEIPRRGRRNRRISDPGGFQSCKSVQLDLGPSD